CSGGSGIGCEGLARLLGDTGADAAEITSLLARARNFHQVHCTQGFAPSCLALADLYRRGEGGTASPAAAAHWASVACHLGVARACRP
ncbi:MAG TPA: hypothetical protein VL172_09280, partial [Kofleriaceae bacterium]|nr:hypothetical protein [Kofleriaceae bacterium]